MENFTIMILLRNSQRAALILLKHHLDLTLTMPSRFPNWAQNFQNQGLRWKRSKTARKLRKVKIHYVNVQIVEKSFCRLETFTNTDSLRLALLRKKGNLKTFNTCLVKIALHKIKEQSVKKQLKQISEQNQEKLALELKGSAQRRVANKRKATRFTEEQKQIMDRCFDSGVKRKSARYTPAQCQKEMERQIGPNNAFKGKSNKGIF